MFSMELDYLYRSTRWVDHLYFVEARECLIEVVRECECRYVIAVVVVMQKMKLNLQLSPFLVALEEEIEEAGLKKS